MYINRRFIPAGAGNAWRPCATNTRKPVHPRGCGERASSTINPAWEPGSSPRVRGTRLVLAAMVGGWRFIPAGAGNAAALRPAGCPRPVHPRGCGERWDAGRPGAEIGGSSPRVRGTRCCPSSRLHPGRFIPAGAGNAHRRHGARRSGSVHPRGCGERPATHGQAYQLSGSSPRVRGTRSGRCAAPRWRRFIPAGAGNAVG